MHGLELGQQTPSAWKNPFTTSKPTTCLTALSSSSPTEALSRRQLLGALGLLLAGCHVSAAEPVTTPLRKTFSLSEESTFDWDDGLQIHLSGDALFHLEESSGERRLQLIRGETAILSAAPAGLHGALQPRLVVVTRDSEVVPLGSRCVVTCRSGRSTVTVLEGAVQVRKNNSEPMRIVRAGNRWPTG